MCVPKILPRSLTAREHQRKIISDCIITLNFNIVIDLQQTIHRLTVLVASILFLLWLTHFFLDFTILYSIQIS